MEKTLELYFSDLTEEAQKKVLKFYEVKDLDEMNWDDVFPLTTLSYEKGGDKNDQTKSD